MIAYNKNLGKQTKIDQLLYLYHHSYYETYIALDSVCSEFNRRNVDTNISFFLEKCTGLAILNTLKKMGIEEAILLGRINDRSASVGISRYHALCVADIYFPIFLHLGGFGGTTLSFYQKTKEMISARGESAYLSSCAFDSFVETESTLAIISPSEALACLNNYGIFPLTAKALGDANYLGITLGKPDQTSSNAHNFFLQRIGYGAISREKLIEFKEILLNELKEIIKHDPLSAHCGSAASASDSIKLTGTGFGEQGKSAFRNVVMQRYQIMVKDIEKLLTKFTLDQYTEQYCTKIDESILSHMSDFSTALRKHIVKCSPGEKLERKLDNPLMSSCLKTIEPSPIFLTRRFKIPVRLPNPILKVSKENYDLLELLQLPAEPDGRRRDPMTRQLFHLNQIIPAPDLSDKIAAIALEAQTNSP